MRQAMTALLVALAIVYALCGWLIWRDWRRTHARRVAPLPPAGNVGEKRPPNSPPPPPPRRPRDARPQTEDLGPLQISPHIESMRKRKRR